MAVLALAGCAGSNPGTSASPQTATAASPGGQATTPTPSESAAPIPGPPSSTPQGWVVVKQGTLELTLDPRWTIDQQTSSGGEDTITASWNGRGDTVMAVSDYNPPRRLPAATLCGANAKASAKQMTKASDAPNLPNPMGDDRVETASCTVRGELDGTAYQIIFNAYQPWKGTRATVMQVRFRAKPFVSADAEPAARTTNLLQKFLIERTPKKG